MKKHSILSFMCAVALLLSGCSFNEAGLKKEYNTQNEVTLTMFGTQALNSKVWSDSLLSKDNSMLHIIERTANYYSKDGKKEDYRSFLETQLKESSDIDLYVVMDEDIKKLGEAGLFTDLSELEGINHLTKEALNSATYEDKVFAIPLVYAAYGMYWNVDLLKQYGLQIPKNQKEMLSVFETLKKNGITPYVGNKGYGLTVPTMLLGMSQVYSSNQKDQLITDLIEGKTPISTYMKKGFDFLELMIEKGYMDKDYAKSKTPDEAIADFKAGKGVCIVASSNYDMSDISFQYEMTSANVLQDGGGFIVTSARKFAINPSSKQIDYAKEALTYILKEDNMIQIAKELKALPPIQTEKIDFSYMGKEREQAIHEIYHGFTIPMEDTRLPFGEWEVIRNLGREMLDGKSSQDVCKEYDQIQMETIQ